MEDFLADVKRGQCSTQQLPKQSIDEQEIIIEEQEEWMPEFKLKVDEVQRVLERIRANTAKMNEQREQYRSATTTATEKQVSQQLDYLIKDNMAQQDRLKRLMESIASDTEAAVGNEDLKNQPETRMKLDMQNALTVKAQAVLQEAQEAQLEFKAGLRQKITRQAGHLDSKLNKEQLEEICEDPSKMQELVSQKLFGQASIQLQNAVQDIQEKYQDILKLERSVQQVYQLFADMAILVKNQGEVIDNIEQNMLKAKEYVGKAEKELIKAKKDHQAARKVGCQQARGQKMCCIIVIGLVLVLVIVGPVLSTSL